MYISLYERICTSTTQESMYIPLRSAAWRPEGRAPSERKDNRVWHNNNGHATTSMLLPRSRREVANGDCMATIAAQFVKLHGNGGHAVAIGGCAASAWQYHGNRKA